MSLAIATLIVGIVAAVAGIATSGIGNSINSSNVEKTNLSNMQAVQSTNQSNVEQAELAYRRSLPSAQVRQLMDAGLSRAGALNHLSGAGSYSAPVLQSSHEDAPQIDLSAIAGSMDRLQNIPTNVEQSNLIDDQRKALEQDAHLKAMRDKREQEQHEYEMWSKMYNKNIATLTDAFNSRISNYAAQNNVDLSKISTKDDFVRVFGLKNDKEWHSLPKIVQDKFYQDALNQARENREIQSQNNANRAANDAHIRALDDLKNSEFGRTLSRKQYEKLEKDVTMAQLQIDDYNNAESARAKEYAARASRADFEKIMSDFGIAEHEFKNANFWTRDKNGNIVPSGLGLQKQGIADAWKFAGTFFGADLLQDILQGLVMIGK